MGNHRQILLANIKEADQHTLAGYESRGGYSVIRRVLGMEPLKAIEEVKKSGLRGRGGAGFPTGVKWSYVPRNSRKPVYVVQNADEGEPGTFKDRLLLERDPHLCIEGMLICAWAVQSRRSFIYMRGEYCFPYMRVNQALADCYRAGYLGDNIFGSGFSHHMTLHRGAGAYICGEETALLESLEGKKGQPRLKPPFFPALAGLYGCPTVVNNTETLAACVRVFELGAEAYAQIGTAKSKGTKLISAAGHINRPGVYEIELGYPLERFIAEECGGVWHGRKLKAVLVGGSSFPVLGADELAGVNLDYESLQAAGSALGSGALIVMDETTDMLAAACNIARFYAHESCGQCTPCREGAGWVAKIFDRLAAGRGVVGDIELIESVCGQIAGHTICAFGDAVALAAQGFIRKFPEEFKARIKGAGKHLPNGAEDVSRLKGV